MRWREARRRGQKPSPTASSSYVLASLSKRLKAFVIDSFMLLMPILYIVFYLVFGSREGFAQQMFMGWLLVLIPFGIATSLFLALKGQTPGYKAYDITLAHLKTLQRPSLKVILFRYMLFIVTCASVVGLLLPFLRKDRLGIYDILSQSAAVEK